jgi:hypothetical protein
MEEQEGTGARNKDKCKQTLTVKCRYGGSAPQFGSRRAKQRAQGRQAQEQVCMKAAGTIKSAVPHQNPTPPTHRPRRARLFPATATLRPNHLAATVGSVAVAPPLPRLPGPLAARRGRADGVENARGHFTPPHIGLRAATLRLLGQQVNKNRLQHGHKRGRRTAASGDPSRGTR